MIARSRQGFEMFGKRDMEVALQESLSMYEKEIRMQEAKLLDKDEDLFEED